MPDEQVQQQLADDVRYIRSRVDAIGDEVKEFRVGVEHRVTKLEMKAGLWGVLGGLLATLGVRWGTR